MDYKLDEWSSRQHAGMVCCWILTEDANQFKAFLERSECFNIAGSSGLTDFNYLFYRLIFQERLQIRINK